MWASENAMGDEPLQGSIKHARAQVKKLLAEKRRLEASNKHLLARQDVLTSGTALADQYLRYFVAEKSLSRQDRQRRHLEKARQASVMNLLPPETWSISVLQYLEGMDIDQYCLFLLDVSVNLKQLLIPSLQYGPAHESYEQLIQVTRKFISVTLFMMRVRPEVVMANMDRDLESGDKSSPLDDQMWDEVVAAIPEAVLTPDYIKSTSCSWEVYQQRIRAIQAKTKVLQQRILTLMEGSSLDGNKGDLSLQCFKTEDPQHSMLVAQIEDMARMIKANYNAEVAEVCIMIQAQQRDASPLLFAYIASSCFPYTINMVAVMAAVLRRAKKGLSKSRPVNIASGTLFTSTRVVTTAAGTHDTTIDSLGTIDLAQSKCEEAPAPESPSPNLGLDAVCASVPRLPRRQGSRSLSGHAGSGGYPGRSPLSTLSCVQGVRMEPMLASLQSSYGHNFNDRSGSVEAGSPSRNEVRLGSPGSTEAGCLKKSPCLPNVANLKSRPPSLCSLGGDLARDPGWPQGPRRSTSPLGCDAPLLSNKPLSMSQTSLLSRYSSGSDQKAGKNQGSNSKTAISGRSPRVLDLSLSPKAAADFISSPSQRVPSIAGCHPPTAWVSHGTPASPCVYPYQQGMLMRGADNFPHCWQLSEQPEAAASFSNHHQLNHRFGVHHHHHHHHHHHRVDQGMAVRYPVAPDQPWQPSYASEAVPLQYYAGSVVVPAASMADPFARSVSQASLGDPRGVLLSEQYILGGAGPSRIWERHGGADAALGVPLDPLRSQQRPLPLQPLAEGMHRHPSWMAAVSERQQTILHPSDANGHCDSQQQCFLYGDHEACLNDLAMAHQHFNEQQMWIQTHPFQIPSASHGYDEDQAGVVTKSPEEEPRLMHPQWGGSSGPGATHQGRLMYNDVIDDLLLRQGEPGVAFDRQLPDNGSALMVASGDHVLPSNQDAIDEMLLIGDRGNWDPFG